MNESSQEALEMARAILIAIDGWADGPPTRIGAVAAVLQKLMDERDTQASRFRGALVMMEARAVAAEQRRNEAQEWAAHLNGRADANMQRANAAQAKLAELVQRVRECATQELPPTRAALHAILADYEVKP